MTAIVPGLQRSGPNVPLGVWAEGYQGKGKSVATMSREGRIKGNSELDNGNTRWLLSHSSEGDCIVSPEKKKRWQVIDRR